MQDMNGGRLWYWGFRTFYHLKHPQFKLLQLSRRGVRLLRGSPREAGYAVPKSLPKRIWIYWEQGWEEAPSLVKLCRDSWAHHNPSWEIAFLAGENLSEYIDVPSFAEKDITRTGYSNIVRLKLLSKYGGVWVDATTFCTTPLDHWLPPLMQSGFFAFHKPKTTIASWFIATEPGNKLIQRWEAYAERFWRFTTKPDIYFWVQYLFEYMIWREKDMRRIWEDTPHINTDGPYAVQRRLKEKNYDVDECVDMVFSEASPVHKLSYKIGIPEEFVEKLKERLS